MGVARLTVGGTVTHTRASTSWVDDPGSRLITLRATNEKPYSYAGTTGYGELLMESSATNYLIHSSAADGATSVAALTGMIQARAVNRRPAKAVRIMRRIMGSSLER